MPQPERSNRADSRPAARPHIGELVAMVKDYARQETLGPLRGAGRWLAFGAAASLALGVGIFFVVLGILRLLQTEMPDTFDGSWSWVPYVIALVVCLVAMATAISRIRTTHLMKEDR